MKHLSIVLLTINLLSINAFAIPETRGVLQTSEKSAQDPQGWWGFLGLNLGTVDSDTHLLHEKDVYGSQWDFRLLGSYYFLDYNWVGDIGLGFQSSQLGRGQIDDDVNAAYIEVTPRYRLSRNWQFGPTSKIFVLGENDFFIDSEVPSTFLGVAVNYEVPWRDKYPVRIGGRAYMDLNVDSRQVTMVMLDLQIGMPFSNQLGVKTVHRRPTKMKSNKVEPLPLLVDTDLKKELEKPVVVQSLRLPEKAISYKLGRVEPNKDSQEFIHRLADLLAKEPGLVDSVEVVGHSDSLGKPLTNEILSNSRAQLIARALSAAGMPSDKIEVRALADRRPIDADQPQNGVNRRVEITFFGVSNESRLREIIKEAKM